MVDSWLNDNTANRHKQTYIKGFLDISGGDLILRNGQQYMDSSYNYSTTDISDNSITSSQEITTNPVWSQVGNTLSSDDYLGFCAMEASGNIIAYTERTSASNHYVHVYQYSDVSNEFQKLGSSIQQSDGNNQMHTLKLNGDGTRVLFACHAVTDPVTGGYGAVEVYEYNTTVSGDWAQVGSTVYGETDGETADGLGQAGFHASSFNAKGDIYSIGSNGYGTSTREGNYDGFQLGRVKVYAYRDSDWTKIGQFVGQNDYTGAMAYNALNDAGTILATGEATDGNDNVPGTVRVYEYEGDLSWNQLGGDIQGGSNNDQFGCAISFNSSGSIMAVGGPITSRTTTTGVGYVRVFEYKTITEEEYNNGNTSSNTGQVSYFGSTTPIIVTNGESWSATTKFWVQLGMDIAGRENDDYFGGGVSLNDDGTILSVQADSGHTQMATDHISADTNTVYVYKYTNNRWMLLGDSIEIVNPLNTTISRGCMLNHDGTKIAVAQEGTARLFEISQITNYASNPTYKTTNRTGNYSIRVGDVSNNNTALSITKNYTAVAHDISGTYSDSYTHYPLLGDLHWTESGAGHTTTSYTQLGLDISVELTDGICKLDASGTRLLTGSNSGVYVYEYSHFTWNPLGGNIGLGGSNTGLRDAVISGNGEYVATYASPNKYNVCVYKYNSSDDTWDEYGTLNNGNGLFLDITHDGQTIIVGEVYYSVGGYSNNGRATVWEYTGDGTTHSWTQVGLDIILHNGTENINGWNVAINKTGNIVVVGAIGYDAHGSNAGKIQAFKYKSGALTSEYTTTHGYTSHNDWEPLGNAIIPGASGMADYQYGLALQMSDDGYTFVHASRGSGAQRFIEVLRYSEELSDWYHYGHGRAENNNDAFAENPRYLEISGDGEMVIAGAILNGNGMVRQYKVLNGKLEPVGPAIAGVSGSYDDLGYVSMSSDGKIVAMGSSVNDNVRVFQLNDVQQTITAHTYKNTETEAQDYIHLGNKTSGNMLEIKGTSEITGDMTINSTGTYQYIDISHVPQSIVLMDENEVYHNDVSYNGALSGYYCAVPTGVRISSYVYEPYRSFQSLIGQASPEATYLPPDQTYSSGTYVGSVITSYKESKTDATYTDLSGEYLQFEFPFMIKPNEFNYVHVNVYWNKTVGSVNNTDISSGMLVGWDGTEWLKLTAIQQSDYNLYGVTKYDLSSNTHYMNKFRLIAHSGNGFDYVAIGAPYLSGTIRTGTVPSMAITSTDTDIKFNVSDLSMAGNLTIEANTFTLKNKDLNTDSDANLIKYFPQAVGGNVTLSTPDENDDEMNLGGSNNGGAGAAWMANVIHHTGSNSYFNGGYIMQSSSQWYDSSPERWAACNAFLYNTSNARTFSARHFMEQSYTVGNSTFGWVSDYYFSIHKYVTTTGAYLGTTTTTFVDMDGNTHNVGGEYLELHTPLQMKYKRYHIYIKSGYAGTSKIMFVGKKNDIYYQLSYPQTIQKDTFYNSIDLDRTDIFVTSIRAIILEVYDAGNTAAGITQLSFDAIPSIDTHLEITNNQFGTVFNAYDKGAKGNIILNEEPHFNKWYLQYENISSLNLNNAVAAERVFSNPTGYVGIGTNKPSAPLTIYGYGGRSSMADTAYMMDHSQSTLNVVANVGNSVIPVSSTSAYMAPGVYVNHTIRTMNYLLAHGSLLIASDERIKTNVKDIDDGVALETLRALKPKTYEYINKINRSETGHVYGFLAQDVSAALPYSVRLQRDCTPNIYEFADISNGSIVLTRNTTDVFTRVPELDASGNALQDASGNTIYRLKNKTLKCMTARGDDFEVTIKEIVDDKRFTIKESITLEQRTHIDISRNIIKDKLFIVGEMVDDFHTMKKSAIWTITTAALQEIDRQLEETKEKKNSLQTQITALLAEVEALKNNAS